MAAALRYFYTSTPLRGLCGRRTSRNPVSDIPLATEEIAALRLILRKTLRTWLRTSTSLRFVRNDIILCLSSAQRAVGLLAMTKDYLSRGIGHY